MINRVEEHGALAFGRGIYDVTGCISARKFHAARERELYFMKKHYVPGFDTAALEQYLQECGKVPLTIGCVLVYNQCQIISR